MEPTRMCARCGGEMNAQGTLYAAVRLVFRPQDTRFLTLQTGDVLTKALMCRDCGMIEIIGDAVKLRHLTAPRGQPSFVPEPEIEP